MSETIKLVGGPMDGQVRPVGDLRDVLVPSAGWKRDEVFILRAKDPTRPGNAFDEGEYILAVYRRDPSNLETAVFDPTDRGCPED